MSTDGIPQIHDPRAEYEALRQRIAGGGENVQADFQCMARLVRRHRELWRYAAALIEGVRSQLVDQMVDEAGRDAIRCELDVLKLQLGYERAGEMERLLIDHVVTTRVRLLYVERTMNEKLLASSLGVREAEFWDRMLSSAHRRYLTALETLARVRRLSRAGPLLQVNIAQPGSRQMNVQGELFGTMGCGREAASVD